MYLSVHRSIPSTQRSEISEFDMNILGGSFGSATLVRTFIYAQKYLKSEIHSKESMYRNPILRSDGLRECLAVSRSRLSNPIHSISSVPTCSFCMISRLIVTSPDS